MPDPSIGTQIKDLVVARESDTYALPLLDGMILQTLERLPDLPGRARLIELASRPVTHPHEVQAEERNELGSKAVFFSVEGTACLYSRGSAARDETVRRENGFNRILCRIIDEHQPKNIWVATFSRLVRSIHHSSAVRTSLENAGSTLHYDGGSINFADDADAEFKWMVMSTFADMERKAVVTRMTLGRCARHRRGQWQLGPNAVPMGYTLQDGRLTVDEDAIEAVHKAVRLMGDPDIGNREIVLALGAIGVLPPQPRGPKRWTYSKWRWDGQPYIPVKNRERIADGGDPFTYDEGYVPAIRTERMPADTPAQVPAGSYPRPADHETGDEYEEGGRYDEELTNEDLVELDDDLAADLDNQLSDEGENDDDDERSGIDDDHSVGHVANPEDGEQSAPKHAARLSLTDYAHLDDAAQRVIGTLDLWTSGRIVTTQKVSLKHVKRFAEYEVHTNANGDRYLEFVYEPGIPHGGWASAEDLAQARAVREQRAAVERQRAHGRGRQLPLLGNLGRWNVDGYRYGLLTAQAGRRNNQGHRYELRRLPLPDQSATWTTGRPRYPGFGYQGRAVGERLAVVDAHELHAAISEAVVTALANGTPVRPHDLWPPRALNQASRTHIDRLRADSERLHAMADRARREYYAISGEVPNELREQFLTDAANLLTEAEAADQSLAVATRPPEMGDRINVRPDQLARVLSGLAQITGLVPRPITVAVNTVLSNLRLTASGLDVHGSIEAHIPADDGLLTVGPVQFTVKQRIAEGRSGTDRRNPTPNHAARAHLRAVSEALLTTDKTLAEVGDALTVTGYKQRIRVLDDLVDLGLKRASANVALDCAPLITRQTVWALLNGITPPADANPEFVQRIRDTYLTNSQNLRLWHRRTGLRGPATDYVRTNGGEVTMEALSVWVNANGGMPRVLEHLLQPPANHSRPDGTMWATLMRPATAQGSRHCTPSCSTACRKHDLVRLRPCPHCHNLLDQHVPVPEVTTALLCGTCLREPNNPLLVFPRSYLDIDQEMALERSAAVNPRTQLRRTIGNDTRALRRNARTWALSIGAVTDDDSRSLPKTVFERYLNEIAGGNVLDQSVVREWAQRNGVTVGRRGRLNDDIVTAYRRDLGEKRPDIVARWVNEQHPETAARIDNPLEAFAAHIPNTTI